MPRLTTTQHAAKRKDAIDTLVQSHGYTGGQTINVINRRTTLTPNGYSIHRFRVFIIVNTYATEPNREPYPIDITSLVRDMGNFSQEPSTGDLKTANNTANCVDSVNLALREFYPTAKPFHVRVLC